MKVRRLNSKAKLWRSFHDRATFLSQYSHLTSSWEEDFEKCQADAKAGVPRAKEMMAEFIAWRLTQ